MTRHFKPQATALALALALGTAFAQTGASGATGTGSTGSSATGGQTAPMAQPGSGTRNSESKKDDKLSSGDRKFVETAAGSGMFEVQAAQLASTKATDPALKSFASMLVDHHTAANSELTKLANSKGVELPAAPPRAMRQDIEKLGKKTGSDFDRDFVREVGVKAHEKDIKLFEKASKDLKDPELKAFASKTLPTLQQHLAQAQKMAQANGKGGGQKDAARTGSGAGGTMGASGSTGGTATTGTAGGASTSSGGNSGANKTGS
jgi:putative membrane protein